MAVETYMNPPMPIEGQRYKDTVNRTACSVCGWAGVVDELGR